jgi:hypothetical protein
MKKLIILFLIPQLAMAGILPFSWFKRNRFVDQQEKASKEIETFVSSAYQNQSEVLSDFDSTSNSSFKLAGFSSGFSISKMGILGFGALKAKESVEVQWTRKGQEVINQDMVFTFVSSSNKKAVSSQIADILQVVNITNASIDAFSLAENLKVYFNDIANLFDGIENTKNNDWYFDGVRSDIYISIDGSIGFIATTGTEVKVRIEWLRNPLLVKSGKKSNISNIINYLLNDISFVYKNQQMSGLELDKVYVGVGYSTKVSLYTIASATTKLKAYIRLKRASSKLSEGIGSIEIDDINDAQAYPMYEKTNQKGLWGLFNIKRKRLRRGLKKALLMSQTFTAKRVMKYKEWEIAKVKTSFDLSHRGWLGFSSSNTSSNVQFEFSNNKEKLYNPYDYDRWMMDVIRVKTKLKFGVEIPFISEITLYPELELFWGR